MISLIILVNKKTSLVKYFVAFCIKKFNFTKNFPKIFYISLFPIIFIFLAIDFITNYISIEENKNISGKNIDIIEYFFNFNNEKEKIEKILEEYFIPIYNNVHPHVSLKGLTPFEVFIGKKLDTSDYNLLCKQAYNDRILLNQQSSCKIYEEYWEFLQH